MGLTKATGKVISDNLSISGIATATNFKTGSTNVHNIGIEAAGINVLGGDTPIGSGSTIYDDGGVRFSGKQIGNYPIVVRYTRRPHGAVNVNALGGGATDIALAENGAMNVSYFVGMTRMANVRESPQGMLVTVAN